MNWVGQPLLRIGPGCDSGRSLSNFNVHHDRKQAISGPEEKVLAIKHL
jgi:hypothetical protein